MNELEKLRAENAKLRNEQDSMFQLLDFTLCAVKKWSIEHGLIFADDSTDISKSPDSSVIKDEILDILCALDKTDTT